RGFSAVSQGLLGRSWSDARGGELFRLLFSFVTLPKTDAEQEGSSSKPKNKIQIQSRQEFCQYRRNNN
ncbi:MAG: hypothetical protein M1553_01255, partial [Firmicutes bacterium]|nr:hypothetical protein [Bacillota bacterium]